MKSLFALLVILTSSQAFACGFDCTFSSCLSYGRSSIFIGEMEGCESASVPHLDPQNFADENYEVLAEELTGGPRQSPREEMGTLLCSQSRDVDLTVDQYEALKKQTTDPFSLYSSIAAAWSNGNQEWIDDYNAFRKEIGAGNGMDKEVARKLVERFATWPEAKKRTPAAKYLRALLGHYSQDYATAIANFEELSKHESPVLSRHALYTLGRTYLFASQKDWDGYATDEGDPLRFARKVDTALAKKATETFIAFTRKFPNDPWAVSAKGLVRRSKVLEGDLPGFLELWNAEIEGELKLSARRPECFKAFFDEVSHLPGKALLSVKSLHPIMWLVRSYYVSRDFPDAKKPADVPAEYDTGWLTTTPAAELKALENDKKSFKSYPDLFAWSKAVLLIEDGKPAEAYEILQAQPVAKTNRGSLSWAVVNARALMGMKKFDEARIQVVPIANRPSPSGETEIGRGAVDFYLSTFIEEGNLAGAYLEGLPVEIPLGTLIDVAKNGFTTKELRDLLSNPKLQARVRDDLERVSVTKHVLMADYDGYLENAKLVKKKAEYKDIDAAIATIKTKPEDPVALYRIGRFINSIDSMPTLYSACKEMKLESDELVPALAYYLKSLDGFAKSKAKNPVEADAIAATLKCFKYGVSSRSCNFGATLDEMGTPQKKALFKRLHSLYKGSRAAKETPVYW